MEKIGVGMAMSRNWDDPPMQILLTLAGGAAVLIIGEYYIATRLGAAYIMLPLIVCYHYYHFVAMATPLADTKKYLEFKNAKVAAKWGKNKIPMHILVAEFLNDNVAFKGDCYEILANHRQEFIDWQSDFAALVLVALALAALAALALARPRPRRPRPLALAALALAALPYFRRRALRPSCNAPRSFCRGVTRI